MERWVTDPMLAKPDDAVRLQSCFIEVSDENTGPTELLTIAHSLNRIPRGVKIVNMALVAGAECKWWRYDIDPAWTERHIFIRLNASGGRVLLEVF